MQTLDQLQKTFEAKVPKLNSDMENIKDQIESKMDPAQYIFDILVNINENMGIMKDLMKLMKQNGYK